MYIHCRLCPHMLAIRTSQTVLKNRDSSDIYTRSLFIFIQSDWNRRTLHFMGGKVSSPCLTRPCILPSEFSRLPASSHPFRPSIRSRFTHHQPNSTLTLYLTHNNNRAQYLHSSGVFTCQSPQYTDDFRSPIAFPYRLPLSF